METPHSNTSRRRGHGISPGPLMQRQLDPSRQRRGYILVMFTLSLFFLLGVIGLAIDIGRMYIAKSEAQSFVDAASLNAAVKLAITPGAFAAATTAAAQTPKTWELGTTAFTNVVTLFGQVPDGPFTASPPGNDPTYTFAQVTARVNPSLYLMSVLVRSNQASVGAMAVAGQQSTTSLPTGGEMPFSPYSRLGFGPDDPNDPFGYKVGNDYTLRWGAKGGGATSTCDGGLDEANYTKYNGSSFRGYCCTGSSNVPDLARSIATGQGTVPVNVGDPFSPLIVPGQKSVIETAIVEYINFDTDTTSTTYAQYVANGTGNGKRVIIVPVNGLVNGVSQIVGFAGFFLYPAADYPKTPASKAVWCAEYIGHDVQGVPGLPPGTGSGVYHLKIYR